MAYLTAKEIIAMDDPEFLVDVVMRNNGTLHMVLIEMDWGTAVRRALSAIEDGLTVEIEESERQ